MSDNPLETTATEQATVSTPVPASTPEPKIDVEAIRKSAAADARREAQSRHDQQIARLHKDYQTRERELRAAVAPRLSKAGYEPDPIFNDVDTLQKARQFDELTQQAQQAAEWDSYVGEVATAYGVTASDPRLQGATSAQDLQGKAKAAMLEDVAKEAENERKAARKAQNERAEAKVENGDFDTLGGAPAAGSPSLDDKYKKEMQAARGKGAATGRTIRDKFRAQGVDVDSVRWSE